MLRTFSRDDKLEDQDFIVAEGVVAGGDDLFAWVETFDNLVILRILATYAYFAANRLSAFRSHHEYPFATCFLVESSARYEHRVLRLAELEVEVIGLAAAYILRCLAFELEVCLEFSVSYFRIDLADDGAV